MDGSTEWDLLDFLTSHAAEEPSFTLRMDTESTGLIHDGARDRGAIPDRAEQDGG